MANDKKTIPETAPPAETPDPEPVLTDTEVVMLEHEGQAALFEMGEVVADPADAITCAEMEEPANLKAPKTEQELQKLREEMIREIEKAPTIILEAGGRIYA